MKSSGFDPLFKGSQILDFRCGAGRMMRHLINSSNQWTIYGCDVSGDHIIWGKEYLSPRYVLSQIPLFPIYRSQINDSILSIVAPYSVILMI